MPKAASKRIFHSKQCGKKRYPSKRLAQEVFNKCQRRSKRPIRIYECPDCAGWHLTSHLDKANFDYMAADSRKIGRIKYNANKDRSETKIMANFIKDQLFDYYRLREAL